MSFYDGQRLPLRCIFTQITRLRAEGIARMPRQGGVVVVCNHLTIIDPLVLGILFPRQLHFMAKEELFRFKPLGWWLEQSGTFPIRRNEVDRAALKHAEQLLRSGEVVMLFPEGHRSVSAQLQATRAGAAMLAARAGCPILPVAIAGTERLARLRGLAERPRVLVRVGYPISLDAGSHGRERKAAADLVMRQIVALLPPAYHGVYGGEHSPH